MSGVVDAWDEWRRGGKDDPVARANFYGGYRRALEDAAERIDRGPQIPLPPSIYSALCREWAEDAASWELP